MKDDYPLYIKWRYIQHICWIYAENFLKMCVSTSRTGLPIYPLMCLNAFKKRVTKLKKQGLMTEAGIGKVKEAKASGLWNKPDRPQMSLDIPKELESALAKNRKAKNFFDQLAPSYQKQFIGWIAVAKRQETKDLRVRESIALLEQGEKLGMK